MECFGDQTHRRNKKSIMGYVEDVVLTSTENQTKQTGPFNGI